MKSSYKYLLCFIVLVIACFLMLSLWPKPAISISTSDIPIVATSTGPVLSLPQELWVDTLEYCESRGIVTAVNKMDLDGTPSYYSFQFKPSTFKYLGIYYGVLSTSTPSDLMTLLKSRDLQREIVFYMVLDRSTNWHQQFPDCVNKFGRPPFN